MAEDLLQTASTQSGKLVQSKIKTGWVLIGALMTLGLYFVNILKVYDYHFDITNKRLGSNYVMTCFHICYDAAVGPEFMDFTLFN